MHDVNTSADHVFLLTIANARSVVRRPRLASPMPHVTRIAEPHRRTVSPLLPIRIRRTHPNCSRSFCNDTILKLG